MDTSKLFTHFGKLGDEDDKLRDYAAWDHLGAEARFQAAWELVVDAWKMQGRDLDELRFQKSVTNLIRK